MGDKTTSRVQELARNVRRYRMWYDTLCCEWRMFDDESFGRLLEAVRMAGPDGFVTVCYNTADVWPSREAAVAFFMECMCTSEGAENDRYQEVFFQSVAQDNAYAHDGVSHRVIDVNDRR